MELKPWKLEQSNYIASERPKETVLKLTDLSENSGYYPVYLNSGSKEGDRGFSLQPIITAAVFNYPQLPNNPVRLDTRRTFSVVPSQNIPPTLTSATRTLRAINQRDT